MESNFSMHIGYYIQEIARKSALLLNEELSALDLTYAQFRVLNTLWKRGTLTQKEILEHICVKPSTLTGLTDQLVKKGLAKRIKLKDDRRSKKVALTPKGEAMRAPAFEIINAFEKRTTSHILEPLHGEMLEVLKYMDDALSSRHSRVNEK